MSIENIKKLHHQHLDDLLEKGKIAMHEMMDRMINSGKLSNEILNPTFILSKLVVTLYGEIKPYDLHDKNFRLEKKILKEYI